MAHLIEQWLDLTRESLSVTTWEGYAGKAPIPTHPLPREGVGPQAQRALGGVAVRREFVPDFYRSRMNRSAWSMAWTSSMAAIPLRVTRRRVETTRI